MHSFGTWLGPADGTWFDSGGSTSSAFGPLATRVLSPGDRFNGLGVVMIPPVGYDHATSFRALHVLAHELAERGCLVARVDPFGTGDSAGLAADVTSLKAWDNAVQEGAAHVRSCGAGQVLLVGCRMGAALAFLAAPSVEATAVAALDPVVSGRRYVRGLQVMSQDHDQDGVGLLVGGTEFPKSLLQEISELDLVRDLPLPAVPCLLAARPGSPTESKLAARLSDGGTRAEVWSCPALEGFLGVHAEQAVIDPRFTTDLTDWICRWAPGSSGIRPAPALIGAVPATPPPPDQSVKLRWRHTWVVERFVTVGTAGLAGVLTTPPDVESPSGDLVVFLNSGSEPHTGPARAWVEYGRDLATHHVSALRIDMRAWGDSPAGPGGRYEPGRPYDPHSIDDAREIVQELGQAGWDRVFLSGLCAGAWVALRVARDIKFGGVLALNPSLLYELGDPVVASADEYRKLYAADIAERKREKRAGRWDREDRDGLRPPAGEWLDCLVDNQMPSSLIFCEDDVGLEYLVDRLSRRLEAVQDSGYVRLHEVPEIDHSMHRTWLRWKVVKLFLDELNHWAEAAPEPRVPGREEANPAC
ncbi:MAG TPA: alpha/beta hydrolase family protein [Acidimicrobiales bacterium]|nr:alpha/beta hydrolase family protein [Acidimicrobiales bacterium]